MKKTIMMVMLVSSLLSFTKVNGQSFNKETNYKLQFSPTVLGAIAGGGFIAAGILQKPDLKWVIDQNSYNTTAYGQPGHWRNEHIWESPGRMAAIVSGVVIMGLSITFSF
jgi:hypoxanthine phosphoribosyltransferase